MYRVDGVSGLNVLTGIIQISYKPTKSVASNAVERKPLRCRPNQPTLHRQTHQSAWRAEPSFLPPDGWSVIGPAGYAVRLFRRNGAGNIGKRRRPCNRFFSEFCCRKGLPFARCFWAVFMEFSNFWIIP